MVVLATAGLFDAVYLSLVEYQVVSPKTSAVERACGLESGECEAASELPEAKIFGIPSAMIAGLFYFVVLIAALFKLNKGDWPLPGFVLFMMGAALLYSIYLSYLLFTKFDSPCPYCLAAHSINAALTALYIMSLKLG